MRVERYNPDLLFGLARVVFFLCLASLPFDLLIASFELEMTEQARRRSELVSGILALAAVASIRKEPLLDLFLSALDARDRMLARLGNRTAWVFLGMVALIALVEAFARASQNAAGLVVGLLFAAGAIASAWKALKEKSALERSVRSDPILWLDNANIAIAAISILPLIVTRAISLIAAFDAGYRNVLPYWLVSVLLLLALAPQHEDFLVTCRRCAGWTSRALKNRGYCQFCARELFQPITPEPEMEAVGGPAPEEPLPPTSGEMG